MLVAEVLVADEGVIARMKAMSVMGVDMHAVMRPAVVIEM
jgi:hypothetical protein